MGIDFDELLDMAQSFAAFAGFSLVIVCLEELRSNKPKRKH